MILVMLYGSIAKLLGNKFKNTYSVYMCPAPTKLGTNKYLFST